MTPQTAEAAARPAERAADLAAAHTLLACYLREVAAPDGTAETVDGLLRIRLPHLGLLLSCRLARVSPVLAHRYVGPVRCRPVAATTASRHPAVPEPPTAGTPVGGGPTAGALVDDVPAVDAPVDVGRLARLLAAELAARTGLANDEFVEQVLGSRDALATLLRDRPPHDPTPTGDPVVDGYVDSEHSLVHGHPHHPSPKWRSGDPAGWRRHAPELRSTFRLSWLAVPADLVAGDGPVDELIAPLDPPDAPPGHHLLPVHPWQLDLMPPTDPRVRGLGPAGVPVRPTASVRTLYAPSVDLFLKTSLHVRITNCLRKNARYELTGAVALTRFLDRVPLPARVGLLREPGYRTVDLPGADEAYGTILRTGLREHLRADERVVLAAALAATPLAVPDPFDWWRAYVDLLVPGVLRLWLRHGVVHEAHLQNVLVVLDRDGRPVRLILRDLEGTKLDLGRLPAWPDEVPRQSAYTPAQAVQRVVYCLFVNHLAGLAGALADGHPGIEPRLWRTVRETVEATYAQLGEPAELLALLDGAPLAAKANLLVRWHRAADQQAPYVAVPNPLGDAG
ncbi:IucA/IucC family protein [Verrucosispora sp. WMMC514]|uniref:IucA/IucC family protein n=1 Tax=Verrucosispora sp. WMMC514 TaxID=3015156 RepID=UPI00248B1C04|nr:IucA/IucC family protein [Verrucosispora sp. WMMC514]WBB90272.1 IucA/IucC family siderophore biosynthesis protein [Verrucosispora sp. WMMC514]